MRINEHIKYWSDSSDNDFQAMTHLFEKRDYTWSLFIGHLVLEKLAESLVRQNQFKDASFYS